MKNPSRKDAKAQIGRAATLRPLTELIPSVRNPRQHSPEHVGRIAASIKEFGFTIPVLVDERGEMIAGHGRVLAAKKLGMRKVPVLVASDWSDAQKRAHRIADNRLTETGSWDELLSREELAELVGRFPPDAPGFDASALDSLLLEEPMPQVEEIETGEVADRFWIVVKGPLARQGEALDRLKGAMDDLGEVTVEAGTIARLLDDDREGLL